MAEKRMFSKKITDSDSFIEMPSTAQALYLHLNQGADDDGFNNQIQLAMWKAHASKDDLNVLLNKNYIILFESGIIVIKHWRMHNTLRKDRYVPSNFQEELKQLQLKDNGAYTRGCQVVDKGETENNKDKDSVNKASILEYSTGDKNALPTEIKNIKQKYGEYKNVQLTDDEYAKLAEDFSNNVRDKAITYLDEYIEDKGYKSQSHNLAIRRWVIEAITKDNNSHTSAYQQTGSQQMRKNRFLAYADKLKKGE